MYGNQESCTITNSNYIICFYLLLVDSYYAYRTISSFDSELNLKNTFQIYDFYGSIDSFAKSIHLKDEIYAFAYFYLLLVMLTLLLKN